MVPVVLRSLLGLAIAVAGLLGAVTEPGTHEASCRRHPDAVQAVRWVEPTPDGATTTSSPSAPDEPVEATQPPSGDGTGAPAPRSDRGTTLAYTLAAILAAIGVVGLLVSGRR